MNTASILIKTDPKVKAKAQETAKELGFSLSSILNAFLKQFVKTKTVNFSAELPEEPNEYFKSQLKKARENRKAGKGSPLFTDDEALIKKNPKKYLHINTMEQWLEKQGI